MLKKITAALPILLLWTSCEKAGKAVESGQKNDKGNDYMSVAVLEVRYDADASSLQARAALWRDSVAVLLPHGLFFNDLPAPLMEVPGKPAHYRYEGKTKQAPERYAFTFSDPKNAPYKFEGAMPRFDSLHVPSTVPLGRPLRLTWDGPPLAEDEALHVMLSDEARGVKQVILDGPTQSSSVTFPADQFKGLQPGMGELTFLRQAIREENVQGIRVKSTLTYYGRQINVQLEN